MPDDPCDLTGGTAVTPEEQEAAAWSACRNRAQRWISELAELFAEDGNPIHACHAYGLAHSYDIPTPEWVNDYLATSIAEVMRICDRACAGEPIVDEAGQVGRAFGFRQGRGETGWFKHAASLERDENMFFEVMDEVKPTLKKTPDGEVRVDPGEKLEMALVIVGARWGVDWSTVDKAATRFLRRSGEGDLLTMQEYVGHYNRCFREGIEIARRIEAARRGKTSGYSACEDVGEDDQ